MVPAVSQAEVDEMAERVRRELKASRRNGVNLSVRPMQGITSSEFNGFAKKDFKNKQN